MTFNMLRLKSIACIINFINKLILMYYRGIQIIDVALFKLHLRCTSLKFYTDILDTTDYRRMFFLVWNNKERMDNVYII